MAVTHEGGGEDILEGDYGNQPTPSTGSTTTATTQPHEAKVVHRDNGLPVTGDDIVGMSVIGGGLLLAGTIVTVARRRFR